MRWHLSKPWAGARAIAIAVNDRSACWTRRRCRQDKRSCFRRRGGTHRARCRGCTRGDGDSRRSCNRRPPPRGRPPRRRSPRPRSGRPSRCRARWGSRNRAARCSQRPTRRRRARPPRRMPSGTLAERATVANTRAGHEVARGSFLPFYPLSDAMARAPGFVGAALGVVRAVVKAVAGSGCPPIAEQAACRALEHARHGDEREEPHALACWTARGSSPGAPRCRPSSALDSHVASIHGDEMAAGRSIEPRTHGKYAGGVHRVTWRAVR